MWRNLQQLVAPDPVDDESLRHSGRNAPPPLPSNAPSGWDDDLDVGEEEDLGEDDNTFHSNTPKPEHWSPLEEGPSQNGGWNLEDDDIPVDDDLREDDPWAEEHQLVESEPMQQPIHVVEQEEEEDPEGKDASSGWDDDNIFDDEEENNSPVLNGNPSEDDRDMSSLNAEVEIISSPPPPKSTIMSQPPQHQLITSLQIQHEQDLQKQYAIIDQKSSIIQSLEQKCWQLEQECDQRCRTLQTEMETLASELISTVQERDMLLTSLHTNVSTIQQLQDQIEQVGDMQNEQHRHLQEENGLLQEQITQSLRDIAGLQQSLQATQSENQQLRQQLHDVMSQATIAEENDHVITNLQQENDALQQERQTIASKFDRERNVILERHAEEEKAWLQELDVTRSENTALQAQVVALQTEHNSKVVETNQRSEDSEQWTEMTQRLAQLQEEMELLQTTAEQEKQQWLEQQNEERSRMQAQIQSMEMECQSWQAKYQDVLQQKEAELQDAVQNGQRAMEETLLIPLRKECDQLRQRIVQLEGEVVSYKQSIEEHDQYVDEQAKWYDDEIQELRQEINRLTAQPNNNQYVPMEEMLALRMQCEQLQSELQIRDEKVSQLINESQKLQNMASLHQSVPEEPPELEILRSRLQVVLDERDALAAENEDLLVQFGYMKQKMDSADEYISSLQNDIKSLQAQLEEFSGDNERMRRNADLDQQIQNLTFQKDKLEHQCHEQLKQIEEYRRFQSGPLNHLQDSNLEIREKITHLESQCKAKDQMIERRDEQIYKLTELLENNSPDSREPEDLSGYREQVRVLEAKVENLQMELDSVKSQLETTEGALNAKEQLYSIQSAVYDLESSVPFRGDVSRFVHESEAHIRELEQELNSKSKVVEELQGSVMNLKFQLDDHDAMNDVDFEASKKDEEILHLKEQIESIQANLLSKEEQLNRLIATEAGISAYNHMKEVDSLRANIVSVARALQRSETNRADTIGRLVSEREAHVLQLRSMSEKLKRFYATVTYGHV
jgi:chromosome segregation ATPase